MNKRLIDIIYNTINYGVEKGIGHLYTEDESYLENTITVNGQSLVNFGSYSYLCLEQNNSLKDAAKLAIDNFGLQFGSSRTYMSATPYAELEVLMNSIFEAHTVLIPTTTLGHIAVMPIVVETGDIILFDQNVHSSVQFMIKHLELLGVPNVLVRHNDMADLEQKIISNVPKYKKVWYMADSVYSMYGDVAPLDEVQNLLEKYKKFNLYIDDAHGMSWTGIHGAGYVLSKMNLSEKVILATSLNKGFSAGGAVFVFRDKVLQAKVKTCGGPLIFSGQHLTSALGAGIECAKLHLSPAISVLQSDLRKNIKYCVEVLRGLNLPDMSSDDTPIFFIGVGLPKVGYNVVKRLQNDGFHVNLAIFPAVSENCTGIRFSVNCKHTKKDIFSLIKSIDRHLYKALQEEGRMVKDIERNFRKIKAYHLDQSRISKLSANQGSKSFSIKRFSSISQIPDRDGVLIFKSFLIGSATLLDLEQVFSNHQERESNWDFNYLMVHKGQVPVFFTMFTTALMKDDVLETIRFSKSIENKRQHDAYYMCTRVMLMGTPLTFGNHIWRSNTQSLTVLETEKILDKIQELFEGSKADSIVLRDMKYAGFTSEILHGMGYIQSKGLCTYEINNLQKFDYQTTLKSTQKYYVRNRALNKEKRFTISYDRHLPSDEINSVFELYRNTHERNFALNTFQYDFSIFETVNSALDDHWDLIRLFEKDTDHLLAIAICTINKKTYNFLIAGLNYQFNIAFDAYSQLLHQLVLRAKQLNCAHLNFGYTTGQNKKKFGAVEFQNNSFTKYKNSYVSAKITNNLLQVNVE